MPLVNLMQNRNYDVVNSILNNTITELNDTNCADCKYISEFKFYNCIAIKSINLKKLNFIDTNAFNSCVNITSVNVPKLQTIGGYGLHGCTKLTTVDFPKIVTLGTGALRSCTGLTSINLGSTITSMTSNVFESDTQSGLTITINRKQDAISGSPWGATNATVVWSGTT